MPFKYNFLNINNKKTVAIKLILLTVIMKHISIGHKNYKKEFYMNIIYNCY